MKHSYADVIPLDRFSAGHVLPKSMAWDSEKLPLGLAPPTITILPFLSSSDGINMQVWPTLTPGALPLGIKEYLWTDKQFTEKIQVIRSNSLKAQLQVLHLDSLTIFLLWVYPEVQALGETPWLSKMLCINEHGIIVFSYFSCQWSIGYIVRKLKS